MKRFLSFSKTTLLVVIISTLTFLIAELLVRIILPQDKMVTWIEMHPDGFVMNQSNGTAFQEFGDRKAEYRFNKERLRGGQIQSDKVNILTIGDSFTFGLLLNEEDTYVHLLQHKANQAFADSIQFLNAAVGGSGLADWPGWLENYGEPTKPDYIIYFMNYDDINRALSKNLFVYDPTFPDSLIPSQRWRSKSFVNKLSNKKWYRRFQANSEIANIIVKVLWNNLYFEDLTGNFDPELSTVPIPSLGSFQNDSDYSNLLAHSILKKIDRWCKQNSCEFLIVTTGFLEDKNMSSFDKKFYDLLKDPDQKFDIEYFENSQCVQTRANSNLDELRIPGDSHPNKKGAKIVADCTWEKLVNKLGNQ
ncbi:MAG: hypothetical protein BalsKO_18620 [Balneolaceae bacterium]